MSQSDVNFPKANWPVLIGFWVLICIVYIARALFTGDAIPLIADTDDAMRLTVIADWMNGQAWFDHVQHRLNTPFGANIHWSRLIDLPIAGLIIVLQPMFGAEAPFVAAWVWPLLLLAALLYLSVGLSVRLSGPDAVLPGLVIPVLSAAILVEFAPGRVDHHNVQIILALAIVYASILSWRTPLWALGVGVASATSLAVGMEALPQIATAVTVFGLFWVVDPSKGATARLFGVGFALSAIVHLVLALPPAQWFGSTCDALSIIHIVAALGVGVVFVIVPLLPLAKWWTRLVAGGLLGAILVAALLVLFPDCRGGPYAAIDPWLTEHWLSQIIEAKPVWQSFTAIPAYTLGIVLPPIFALFGILWIVLAKSNSPRADSKKVEWLILGLFLAIGLAVMLVQVRGARLVAGMIAPVGAYAIIAVRQRYLKSKNITDALVLLGTWLLFSGLAIAVVAGLLLPKGGDENVATANAAVPSKYACLQPEAFYDLEALPPERIMAPVDLGAHMLLFTPHSVVGAPYHRNQQGLLDTFAFFNKPLEQSRTILANRGISLIVTCPSMPEMRGFSDTPDTAFVHLAASGNLPDWIEDVSLPGSPLKTYAVLN